MSGFYIIAGLLHFINSGFYQPIMPSYIPIHLHLPLIYVSGACETIFGLLLIPMQSRKIAAWLIIALLIAVFPANAQMALNYWKTNNSYLWLTIIRLPIQFVLIWWAWQFTKRN